MANQNPVPRRRRTRLRSLTDVQRQMEKIYALHTMGELTNNALSTLSQHLNRLHQQFIAEREVDISEELLALEQQLTDLEHKKR